MMLYHLYCIIIDMKKYFYEIWRYNDMNIYYGMETVAKYMFDCLENIL